jgi:hypothetical protein
MGYGTADVYYQPEKFDLVPVAELEMEEPNWSFDILMVWKHIPTGRLLTARDSGCSCPSPFENYTTLESLDEVNYDELAKEAMTSYDQNAAADFLRTVRDAM